MIYFEYKIKYTVAKAVVDKLKPGGWLFIGHSESLHGMDLPVELVAPAIYRKKSP